MTKETAEAVGIVLDRLTRPVVTLMFASAICWMGVRTVTNISADQFVAIVMAVVLFWFGSRGQTTTPTTTTEGGPATVTTGPVTVTSGGTKP